MLWQAGWNREYIRPLQCESIVRGFLFFTSNELKSTLVCDLGDFRSSRPCMGVQEMLCFQCSVKRYHTFFVSDSFLPDTVSEKEKETRIMIITLKDGSKKEYA